MGGGGRRTEEDMSPDEDSDTEEYRTSVNDVDLVTAGLFLFRGRLALDLSSTNLFVNQGGCNPKKTERYRKF